VWQAARAELAYALPFLLGAFGIAAGAALVVTVVFLALGGHGPPGHIVAGLRAMFVVMAPIIVGYIIQGTRVEERRTRLLLAGSLTPLRLAGVTVLLPAVLFGIGTLAAGAVLGAELVVTGRLARASVSMPGNVGTMMFLIGFLVLLAQEAAAAGSQRRLWAAAAGWIAFLATVLLLAGLTIASVQGLLGLTALIVGHLGVAATASVVSAALFAARTDFTR